jgi:hypothetical protein
MFTVANDTTIDQTVAHAQVEGTPTGQPNDEGKVVGLMPSCRLNSATGCAIRGS